MYHFVVYEMAVRATSRTTTRSYPTLGWRAWPPLDGRSHVTTKVVGTQGYADPNYVMTGEEAEHTSNPQVTASRLVVGIGGVGRRL